MRAADPIAARAFYGEAIALAEGHCDGHCVPASEVAKLHANRCAALLAMERPGEALADARRAAALAPTWSKACYRLGGVLHKLGRLSAAKTALRRAAARAAEGGAGGGGGGGMHLVAPPATLAVASHLVIRRGLTCSCPVQCGVLLGSTAPLAPAQLYGAAPAHRSLDPQPQPQPQP